MSIVEDWSKSSCARRTGVLSYLCPARAGGICCYPACSLCSQMPTAHLGFSFFFSVFLMQRRVAALSKGIEIRIEKKNYEFKLTSAISICIMRTILIKMLRNFCQLDV